MQFPRPAKQTRYFPKSRMTCLIQECNFSSSVKDFEGLVAKYETKLCNFQLFNFQIRVYIYISTYTYISSCMCVYLYAHIHT